MLTKFKRLIIFAGIMQKAPLTSGQMIYEFTPGSQWTWLGQNTIGPPGGYYGTKGVPDLLNFPGTRIGVGLVVNPNTDIVYMFGGNGYTVNYYGGTLSMNRIVFRN